MFGTIFLQNNSYCNFSLLADFLQIFNILFVLLILGGLTEDILDLIENFAEKIIAVSLNISSYKL